MPQFDGRRTSRSTTDVDLRGLYFFLRGRSEQSTGRGLCLSRLLEMRLCLMVLLCVQVRAEIDCDQYWYNVKIVGVIGLPKRLLVRGSRL